ncbi:MAG: tetratricopeptide repeat protein [Anaerolineae bacterium]|nr:tetratricopeptide repeat protein [Anaerolineae bacterium]
MMREKRLLLVVLIGLLALLLTAQAPLFQRAVAQPETGAVRFAVGPRVDANVARGTVTALADRLAAHGVTSVLTQPAGQVQAAAQAGSYAVLVELVSLAEDCCASPYSFVLHITPRPPRESLLSPAVEATHITLRAEASPSPARLDFIADLLAALVGYSQEACDLPLLEVVRDSAPDYRVEGVTLDYIYARCLYAAREYEASVAVLENSRAALPESGWLATIWEAALAQTLAQRFQFDAALALDDALIAALEDREPPLAPEGRALLAELYLLRGQHRLYLYEWDAVLADYETALALTPENARAHYLRGLLHMAQVDHAAARQDLTRFLALERAQAIPDEHPTIIDQAEAYLAEVEALLLTPQPD